MATTRRRPPDQRRRAIVLGAVGAAALRIIFTALIAVLLGIPVLQARGGALWMWMAFKRLRQKEEGEAVRADQWYSSREAAMKGREMDRQSAGLAPTVARLLWLSRWAIIGPVACGILMVCAAFYIATVDVISLLHHLGPYLHSGLGADTRSKHAIELLSAVITAAEGYLLGAIPLLLALGLYQVFIGTGNAARASRITRRLVHVRSLSDLTGRLGMVVLLLLVFGFLQRALRMTYRSALDLLYLTRGLLLVGGALYAGSRRGAGPL